MDKHDIQPLLNENFRNQRLEELNALPSSLDKIKFWYKLGLNWIDLNDYDTYYDLPLKPFKFSIPESEYLEVNEWLLKNYTFKSEVKSDCKLISLDQLVHDFEESLADQENQRDFILKEQRKIDHSFENAIKGRLGGLGGNRILSPSNFNENYFAQAATFFDFYKYQQPPDYSKVRPFVSDVVSHENGYTLARFRDYLDDSLEELAKTDVQEGEITIAQKLLLLQELKVLELLETKIKVKAKVHCVLSLLIGGDTEYLKKSMAIVGNSGSRIQSNENLEFVANILDKAGLEVEALSVRKRLEKKYKK
jgi:hypothetical protein